MEKILIIPTGSIWDNIMKMRDGSREILNRKVNGTFITRLLLRSEGLNSDGVMVTGSWRITGAGSTKRRSLQHRQQAELKKTARTRLIPQKQLWIIRSPEFYLKNLPLNDTLLAASNERIASAYLNAGKAYAEKIADRGRATESFEALLKRFPANELIPEALYSLYQVNKDSNTPVAESYRQRLLEKYPSTEYAKILSDPDYYEKKLADIKMAGQMYAEAYKAYTTENFTAAISIVDEALDKYSQDMLAPKFLLLRAYSVARTTDERTFRDELNKLIKTWPDSEESKKAGEIIAYLNQKLPELKVEEEKEIAMELFIADTASTHVFALVINDPAFNINLATFDVISYNIDNYTNKNYRTEGTLIDNRYIMITVSGFSDYSQTLDYYNTFKTEKLVRNSSGSNMYTFIISSNNLNVLTKDKNPDRYLLFFKENYLK